jgi:hypothetical protein
MLYGKERKEKKRPLNTTKVISNFDRPLDCQNARLSSILLTGKEEEEPEMKPLDIVKKRIRESVDRGNTEIVDPEALEEEMILDALRERWMMD